mgnify:CR=1 FL=1
MSKTEEKVEEVIWIILFVGVFILSIFIPYLFSIFILSLVPYWLIQTVRFSRLAVSITMLILLVVVTIPLILTKFKLDLFGTIMIFCPVIGYILTYISSHPDISPPSNINKKV